METQTNQTNPINQPAPVPPPAPPRSKAAVTIGRGPFIALCAAVCLSALTAVAALAVSLSILLGNATLSGTVTQLKARVSDLQQRMEYAEEFDRQYWIAADARFNCYNPSFYTEQVVFCDQNEVYLDWGVQDSFAINYINSGKFRMTDYELEMNVLDFIEDFTALYDKNRTGTMPKSEELTFKVSVYGWDIAEVKGGKVTLVEPE